MMHTLIAKITFWDVLFFTSIFKRREIPFITYCMRIFSASGDGYLYPLMAAGLLLFTPDPAMHFSIAALAAFALEQPAYHCLKRKIRRNRPFETIHGIRNRVVPSDQFSFPSGHTAAACIIATLLAYFFPATAIPAFLWASLVGLSRVYLGVHYPSDILAGAVIGLVCAMAGIYIIP
jgi:undecaprenyl-diphosphatase